MSLIVVTGATGIQGGSVARTLAKDQAYKVRGLTRNPTSDKAKELAALGIEVVQADLEDPKTLPKAFEGAEYIFCTTDFWAIAPKDGIEAAERRETNQFVNVATVANELPALKHLVLSTMPNCDKISGGKFPCPHWDAKARGGEYVREKLPKLAAKTTEVWMGWYLDNLVNSPIMAPQPFNGAYIFPQPSKPDGIVPVAGIVSVNTGLAVQAIFAQPQKTFGKYVPVLTDLISWVEVTEGWSKATGKTAVYAELPDSEIAKLYGPVFGAEFASQLRFSEQYPDWYSYKPQETISLKELGIGDKVYDFKRGLELIKPQITPA
ncbi:hypothetical protein DL769_008804 [Monosporascus sp. CRB-8-3]|nr:hypothetical protein DL769_008804 [Monosporascus sp. CRB-8-3]